MAFKLPWQLLKSTPRNEESTSSKPSQIGLRTLVEPLHDSATPPLNIVFVHGLGGSAEGTWTDSQADAFWPPWLTKLGGLENARIMTFGYDSGWNKIWKPNNVLDISDFAKQLVNDLWCHYLAHGDAPTVFVAHSMGGLVVKKALITAHSIERYHQITQNTIAIAFLGTPHRGADLADLLKTLLNISYSETRFVRDLSPSSQSIKEINDAFRERAKELELASFWESTGMPVIGVVVPEHSATLEFGGEIRLPLNGDHIRIVKFASEEDNNYRVISRTLAGMVQAARNKAKNKAEVQSTAQLTLPIIPALQTPTPATSQITSAIPSSSPSAISNLFERSIFHVPYDRNPYFTGREELLATIRHKIQDSQLKGYKHRIALYGLGGVGKTQMTLEYCFRYKRDYDYIFWMSAADETRLLSSFAQVATLTECVQSTSEQNPQEIARIVLRWLHSRTKWLMVFDNLDDISVINGYLPPVDGSGHVLITTRNKHCDGIPAEGIEVIPLNSTESVSFLLMRSGLQDDPRQQVKEEATKIVHELGHLPLAVEQAAAYIRTSQNIFEYLPTYHQSRKDLLSEKPRTNHPYTESIGTTWTMSLHRLSPNAIKLIQILAFLNPDEILIEFLKAGKTGLLPEFQHLFNTDFVLRQSLRDLEGCSLLRVWDEGQKITIHRLVQYVIRDDLEPEAESRMTLQIIQMGIYAFPSRPVENLNTCRRYQSQVTAIIASSQTLPNLTEGPTPDALAWLDLASRLALYLRVDGYYLHSLKSFEECLEVTRKLLGEEHPQTLWNLECVALSYQRLGKFNHALKLFQECYERRGRVLGPEHPDTLHSMNGVGEAYTNLGRFTEGLKMHEECFEAGKRVMGLEHLDTLGSMHNVAAAYFALGKFNQALHFEVEVFEGRKRVLGPEHPETLRCMDGMAATYTRLGRLHEGLKLCDECLEIRKVVLGSEHPETLRSMENLAATYTHLGRFNEALEFFEECFETRKRVLGVEHPDTLWSMNGVAVTYSHMGRSDEAANVCEKCFEMRERVLGGEHPDTLTSMNMLGAEYLHLGRFTESMEILENCLEIRKRILGPTHPDTLWSMSNLSLTYARLGRLDEAVKMQENCLELRRKVLGEDHPETLDSMADLGWEYANQKRFTEAAEIHENCLESRKRILGLEHPGTLWSMDNLAMTYADLGRLDEAIKMQGKCLELRRKVLGEEHSDTLASMNSLEMLRRNLDSLKHGVV